MGAKWPFESLGPGECIVSYEFQDYGFKINESFDVYLKYSKTLKSIAELNYNPIAEKNNWPTFGHLDLNEQIIFPCKIKDFTYESFNKAPRWSWHRMIWFEYKAFL